MNEKTQYASELFRELPEDIQIKILDLLRSLSSEQSTYPAPEGKDG